jgi:hypothetical protein
MGSEPHERHKFAMNRGGQFTPSAAVSSITSVVFNSRLDFPGACSTALSNYGVPVSRLSGRRRVSWCLGLHAKINAPSFNAILNPF